MNARIPLFPFLPFRRAGLAAGVTAALLAGLLPAPPVPAQEQDDDNFSVSGSVELGAEYNSNLSVSELESASGRSDGAGVLDAALDLSWQPAPRVALDAGYSYSASRYSDLDSYDLDMHLLYADLSRDFGPFTLGANYYFADAGLGGDDFLELDQYSLYAGKLLNGNWYLRGALNFSDKAFATFAERDADNQGYSIEIFRFFEQGRSNLMLGYGYEDEETRAAPYAYEADSLRLRYSRRFSLASRDSRLQLGYRWQDRDYLNVTPLIGARRGDRRQVLDANLEVSMLEQLDLIGGWEYGNYRSNLDSADFNENRLSLSARLSF